MDITAQQNPNRFIGSEPFASCSKVPRVDESGIEDVKDLTLCLLRCGDVKSLGSVIKTSLQSYIPRICGGALFYVDEDTGDVYTADDSGICTYAPIPDCIKKAYSSRQKLFTEVASVSKCVLDQIRGKTYTDQTKVGCFPVLDEGREKVYAILVVVGEDFNEQTTTKLSWLEKQIAACYTHIQRTFTSQRGTEERASQQLIKLCGELYDQDAAQLQLKVIKYLEEQTQAECGFLLLVVPDTQELFCQVIGKKILEEEVKFPGLSSSFSVALETKQPINLDDIPMENRAGIEDVIECPLHSFLCVPVMSRSDNSLIALACMANKRNANRFTERDILCIRQCFRYTATVLTSTLAFQNERKLKVQTQAMLQVARHLFTNLGELIVDHSQGVDNFPLVRTRDCEVNIGGKTLFDFLRADHVKPCQHCKIINSELDFIDDKVCSKKFNTPLKGEVHRGADNGLDENETIYLSTQKVPLKTLYNLHSCPKLKTPEITVAPGKDQFEELNNAMCENPTVKVAEIIEEYANEGIFIKAQKETEESADSQSSHYDNATLTRISVLRSESGICEQSMARNSADLSWDDGFDYISVATPDKQTEDCFLLSPIVRVSESQLSFRTASEGFEDDGEEIDTSEEQYLDTSDLFERPITAGQSMSDISCVTDKCGDSSADELNFQLKSTNSNIEPFINAAPTCTPVDSKPELNNAFLNGLSEISFTEKFPESPTKANTQSETGEDSQISLLSVCCQVIGVDQNQKDNFKSESCLIVVQDSETGSCHSVESKSSMAIEDTCKDETDTAVQVVREDTDVEVAEVVVTVSDANITDIQAPITAVVPIIDKDLTKLLREIMQQARNLTQAERCSVFLIDSETDELVAKVFDGITTNKDNEVQEEIRMPCNQGIAGHVATSGDLLNIKDAYSHPLFYRGIDDSTGFRTRNILCFPIKDEKGKILGVAQLCNKKTGPCFTTFDEDLATAFGIYCCISISHSLMYKKVIDSQVRNSLANELMMYHMKCLMYKRLQDSQHRKSLANELMIYHMQVCPEDVTSMSQVDIPHPRLIDPEFIEFSYAPRMLPENNTLLACLSMFEDLNFISRWRIRRETLARFMLMVKKGYRNPPYHNWMHAYTVAQFCYQLIRNMQLDKHLEDIELFALFVSCLCHDIDHRGTNNSFQTASKSVLAALYSSEGSVLERHHFAQTMCILNTEGCNIFENLNSKDYQQVLDHTRDIILATDLAHHLKILKTLKEIADRGFDRSQIKDRKLLLCLLMTSCDLSDQTKPWENTKNVAALIYKEFFSQGDMEKAQGHKPIEMMDRERAQIPALQIGFLDHIAAPVYKVLTQMFPEAKAVVDAVENNKQHWEKISNLIKLKRGGSCARMTFEEVLAIEHEDDTDEPSEQNHTLPNGS